MDLALWLKAVIFLFNFLIKTLDLKAQASLSRFDGSGQVPESDVEPRASRSRLDGSGQVAESLHFSILLLIQKLGFGVSGLQVQI